MAVERIGYYCPRINHLKLYGPVVAEQRSRGFGLKPVMIVPVAPLITYRAKNRELAAGLQLAQIRAQLGGGVRIVEVDSPEAFLRVLRMENVRVMVSVGLRLPEPLRARTLVPSRRDGVLWAALGYLQEELLQVLQDGPSLLDYWDVPTTFGTVGVDLLAAMLRERGIRDTSALQRMAPIGFVELDQVQDFRAASLREKYGIAPDRPVVYFSTAPQFPMLVSRLMRRAFFGRMTGRICGGRAARVIWGRRWAEMDYLATYSEILEGLRTFARRHGAQLIAKTRTKHHDPRYLGEYVDRIFEDGLYYPFRTLELIYLSDLYVGMPSWSSLEAAFIGRRLVNLVPFPPELFEYPEFFPLRREFYFGKDGLWDAEGFSRCLPTYRSSAWEEFREWANGGSLETRFDADARRRVVEKAIGFDDFKASRRFLDLIEAALHG